MEKQNPFSRRASLRSGFLSQLALKEGEELYAPNQDTSVIWPKVKLDKSWPTGSFNKEFATLIRKIRAYSHNIQI